MVSLASRGRVKLAAVAALVVLGAVMGFKRYKKAAPEGPTGLVAVELGDIETHFIDSGELSPKVFVDIASKVSGRVIELPIDEGSRVQKGDRLAVIQPGRTEAEQYVPTTLTAPIDGVVMRFQKQGEFKEEGKLARLGDYVTGLLESTNPTYLMTIADLSRLVVKMKISEMDILKLREGMPVTVTIDALPGQSFPAKVSLVAPQAEKDSNNLKSFKVEISLLRSDARLKPGMTARVDGLLEARKKVLKLPLSAVFEEAGKEIAYLHDPLGAPKKVPLALGLRSEMEAELREGLKAGDKLLTEKPEEKPKLR